MLTTHRNKWAAFLLSLIVPGSGQLLAGSGTAVVWFAAVVGAAWLVAVVEQTLGWSVPLPVQGCLFLVVGALSAIDARDHLERRPWRPTRRARSTVACSGRRGRNISMRITVHTPHSRAELWQRVSDLRLFLTVDPFHEHIVMMRERPAQGVHLVLHHNAFGWRFKRFGRILRWSEGRGFAYSDLSSRGNAHGFPHVFYVRVDPCDNDGCSSQLVIEVKGRWTARWIPAWLGREWIRAVCCDHARLLRQAL